MIVEEGPAKARRQSAALRASYEVSEATRTWRGGRRVAHPVGLEVVRERGHSSLKSRALGSGLDS